MARTAAHGVPIAAGGQPPDVCFADEAKESWRVAYQSYWGKCMLAAYNARTQAAGALQRLGTAAGPPGRSGSWQEPAQTSHLPSASITWLIRATSP